MKIFIAAFNEISERQCSKAKSGFLSRFKSVRHDDFVYENPDIIWFLTGGSEHNALKQIEAHNRYAFIASENDNSWAAATEVKAYLNSKGIITRVFNLDKLKSLESVYDFLNPQKDFDTVRLGLVGEPADWLVASIPDFDLLKEVLNIEVVKFAKTDLLGTELVNKTKDFQDTFAKVEFDYKSNIAELYDKICSFASINNLDALSIDCFNFIKNSDYAPCCAFSVINDKHFPVVCEGDLCSAAGMIVCFRFSGLIPWMANLKYISKDFAGFSHCTVPLNMTEKFSIVSHFESGKSASIKGELKKELVTVFRIDRNLENCFLALGEIYEDDNNEKSCRTQVKIKMSSKSLFLLREFPLGNHHLIIPGDYTDILAEYFTNKGFRIV